MKSILYLLISLILSSYFSEYIHFDFLPGYDDIASNPVFADTVELNTDSGPALFFICVIDILFFLYQNKSDCLYKKFKSQYLKKLLVLTFLFCISFFVFDIGNYHFDKGHSVYSDDLERYYPFGFIGFFGTLLYSKTLGLTIFAIYSWWIIKSIIYLILSIKKTTHFIYKHYCK